VVDLSNRKTAPTRVQAGVGIGAALEQQLGDFQVIRATRLKQRSVVGSQVLRCIRIGAVFEQQADNVQMAFPRRMGQRADARRVETPGQADILALELLDAFLITDCGRHGNGVTRSVGEQAPNQHGRVSKRRM
jgi:hypothetical protein